MRVILGIASGHPIPASPSSSCITEQQVQHANTNYSIVNARLIAQSDTVQHNGIDVIYCATILRVLAPDYTMLGIAHVRRRAREEGGHGRHGPTIRQDMNGDSMIVRRGNDTR